MGERRTTRDDEDTLSRRESWLGRSEAAVQSPFVTMNTSHVAAAEEEAGNGRKRRRGVTDKRKRGEDTGVGGGASGRGGKGGREEGANDDELPAPQVRTSHVLRVPHSHRRLGRRLFFLRSV